MNQYMIVIGAFTTKEKALAYSKKLEKDGYPSFIISNVENENMKPVKKPKRSIKELADEVLKKGLNGDDRKKFLGDRYQEVQNFINKTFG